MKESISDLIEFIKQNRHKSPWARQLTVEKQVNEFLSEVKEFEEAFQNKDNAHMKEEIGDVFIDVLHLIILCEEKGLFTVRGVIQDVLAKMKRRKPFLFDGKGVKTVEEESTIWNKIKEEEKKGLHK